MTTTPRRLYLYVLAAIALGALFGYLDPQHATQMKPLGDGFIKLIKMLIAPVIFCTVVSGIAGVHDAKKVGRVGAKALLYFEVVSTLALIIGLVVMNVVGPGRGFNIDPATLDPKAVAAYAKQAGEQNATDFIMHIIPKTFGDAFTANGRPVTLSATLTDPADTGEVEASTPIAGKPITFILGSGADAQSCEGLTDGSGTAFTSWA